MYLAETESNEIKKIVQIRVYLTGKDQAAAQPWQQFLERGQQVLGGWDRGGLLLRHLRQEGRLNHWLRPG